MSTPIANAHAAMLLTIMDAAGLRPILGGVV